MPQAKRNPNPAVPPEIVNPLWLAKAVGITLIAALVCSWMVLCLLFYQGQWQLVLHPSRSDRALPPLTGITAAPIQFDATETGIPRLSGVFLPSAGSSRYAAYTVLYLRGGDSCLAQDTDDAITLSLLHNLDLTVFAFDYRGFGASDPTHPTLRHMTEDAQAALRTLLSRGVPEDHVILYGRGVGASLATTLALDHPRIPALVLDDLAKPSLQAVLADPRTRALPVRWLFHEDFSIEGLAHLATPKLLISYPDRDTVAPSAVFAAAADPKITLELPRSAAPQRSQALLRFLDLYLSAASR